MKVNNAKRLTITLSTLCLASTLFCSANAHTALKKGCYDASVAYPLGDKVTMVHDEATGLSASGKYLLERNAQDKP